MPESPFAPKPTPPSSFGTPRRSTRVDFVTPVILTGRDASGQLFREQTQTIIVNLHGCRLRVIHTVMVGMLFMLECPEAGTGGEAVCVHVWDPPSGESASEIALQLVKPQNMWGIENPPADWEEVLADGVVGRLPRTKLEAGPTPIPPRVSLTAAPSERPGVPTADSLLGELEQRATQLMESVLRNIRNEADEVMRQRLQEFREQVGAVVKDAEARLRECAGSSLEEARSSLDSLRTEVEEKLASRTEEIADTAEQAVRAKVGELFETLLKPTPANLAESDPEK